MSGEGRSGVFALVVASVLAAGCAPFGARGARPQAAQGGAWTDEHGDAVSLERFRGAPFILSAFFTSCTVRCPMTVSKLKDVDAAYRRSGRTVPIVLLTIDPHTDTPERLERYKQAHGLPEHWHFLHGSDADTRALARSMGVAPAYDDNHIDHQVRIAVMGADGQVVRSFSGWSFDVAEAVVR